MTAAVAAIAAALASGCSGVAADELRVGGTGAALGLMERLGGAFVASTGGGDTVRVLPSLGSGGGIAAARDRAIEVAISARGLADAERTAGMREFPLLRTPLILVTSRRPPPGLTRLGLPALFARNDPAWPDGSALRPILRSSSETTVQLFADGVPGLAAALAATRQRRYIPIASNDQENFAIVRATPGSLSMATYVQLRTEGDGLAAVPLDGITPSLEALEAGEYVLAGELKVVIGAWPNAVTMRFLGFLRTAPARAIMRGAGGIPLEMPAGF